MSYEKWAARFKRDLIKTLATADGFNRSPFTEGDIPFPHGRSYDAAEAFLRAYNGIVQAGLPKAETAAQISSAYANTLGKVAYDGAAGDPAKGLAVQEWSRSFFKQAIVSKDATAQQRLDSLLAKPAFNEYFPALQMSDMLARMVLLPYLLPMKVLRDRRTAKEVEARLAHTRPVAELESAAKKLNRASMAISITVNDFNKLAAEIRGGAPLVTIHPYDKNGQRHEERVERDSPKLKEYVQSEATLLRGHVAQYTAELGSFNRAYDALHASPDQFNSLNADSIKHMKSTALVMEQQGKMHAKTGKAPLVQAIPTLQAHAQWLQENKLISGDFTQFAGDLTTTFGVANREKLREQAREAGHAVLQFDMKRASDAIDRATLEQRAFNPIEEMSISTAMRDGKAISGYLNELYDAPAGTEEWLNREREQKRMKDSLDCMSDLAEKAKKTEFLSKLGHEITQKLMEALEKMDPFKALKGLFDKMMGKKGPAAAPDPLAF